MCIHGKFMSTQIVTVYFHFLPLFSALVFLSLTLSVDGFLIFTFQCSGPHSMVRLACALEWLSAISVAVADPGILSYYLFSTEVINLGLTSVSSDVSLSVRDLLWFVGSSCFFSAIRLLFIVFLWA